MAIFVAVTQVKPDKGPLTVRIVARVDLLWIVVQLMPVPGGRVSLTCEVRNQTRTWRGTAAAGGMAEERGEAWNRGVRVLTDAQLSEWPALPQPSWGHSNFLSRPLRLRRLFRVGPSELDECAGFPSPSPPWSSPSLSGDRLHRRPLSPSYSVFNSGGDVVCLSWVTIMDELAGDTGKIDLTSLVS